MKKLIIITTLILFNSLQAQNAPEPYKYSFFSPEFEKLIPFSKGQLDIIKKEGIKKVIKIHNPGSDTLEQTVFYFNENGNLIKQNTFAEFGQLKEEYESIEYAYDENSNLILKRMHSKCFSSYDSIAYNNNGLVVYYESYDDYNPCHPDDKFEREWNFKLVLNKTNNTLVDKIDPEYPIEFNLNKENKVVTVEYLERKDSVSVSILDNGFYNVIFWTSSQHPPYGFMGDWDTNYRIGNIKLYKGNNILSDCLISQTNQSDTIDTKTFFYNDSGKLQRMSSKNSQVFYTYDKRGLVKSKIDRIYQSVRLIEYKYLYN